MALDQESALLLQAYLTTIGLWFGALLVSLVIGTLAASGRVWGGPVIRASMTAYVEFFRNTPLLVQLLFLAVLLAPANLNITREPVVAALIGLGIYTGAYTTEVIRAGIASVDARQLEAARSLGLSQFEALRFVVMPQAIRTVVPPLGNLSIALVKNTAVAGGIAALELVKAASIVETRTGSYPFVGLLLAYWSLTLPLAWLVGRLERRMAFQR